MKESPVTDFNDDVHQHLREGIFFTGDGRCAQYTIYDPAEDVLIGEHVLPWEEYRNPERVTDRVRYPRRGCTLRWPVVGAVNIPDSEMGAVYVKRRTAQQYRRAFTLRFCDVGVLGVRTLENRLPGDKTIYRALVYPVWYGLDDTLALLEQGKSVAVSYAFTLVPGTNASRSFFLYSRDTLVGRVDRNGELLTECSKFIRRRWEKAYVRTIGR